MQITINHEESTTGILNKKTFYNVVLNINFSHEELAIIDKHKLHNSLLYTVPSPMGEDYSQEVRIGLLVKRGKVSRAFKTPLEAKDWEEELKTNILPQLKNYIMQNTQPAQKSQSFEL